ncbi:hypothetical protein EIL50_00455 [bacterium NHP-B]|nr:hypothetical protein EIL50_00455 [bacterium NHP-B]
MTGPITAFLHSASFGVLAAFVVFFALFAKQLWRALMASIAQYQSHVIQEAEEAEKLLKEAEALLSQAQKEAQALSARLAHIKEGQEAQIAHIQKNGAQTIAALRAQYQKKVQDDITSLKRSLAKRITKAMLAHTSDHLEQKLQDEPLTAPLAVPDPTFFSSASHVFKA